MFEKVKGFLSKGLDAVRVRLNQFQQPIKWIVMGYLVTVFLFVVSYYGFWMYLAVTGKIQLPDLLAMVRELVGPAMVGFVTFIAEYTDTILPCARTFFYHSAAVI